MVYTPLSFPPSVAASLRDSVLNVAVTGAGGWMGQAVLEMLESALGESFSSRVAAFGAASRKQELRSGTRIAIRPLADIVTLSGGAWLIFHCAFLTRDKLGLEMAETYIANNRAITRQMADACQQLDVRGVFMPSSGAVYRKDGALDDDMDANPYGVLKLEDEKIFAGIAARKNCAAIMPRVFNMAGPFVNKTHLYALASMIEAAQSGGPILIRAPHKVMRSFMHVKDILSIALAQMLDAPVKGAFVYDTAGEKVVEMADLAREIAAIIRPDVAINRPPADETKQDIYVGDATVIHTLARRYVIFLAPLDAQIRDTADYLLQKKNELAA
jgi:UDP-glucuronate decarboxylase